MATPPAVAIDDDDDVDDVDDVTIAAASSAASSAQFLRLLCIRVAEAHRYVGFVARMPELSTRRQERANIVDAAAENEKNQLPANLSFAVAAK